MVRSTFPSQKCRKLTGSEHSWKFRCRKSARPCGAKHISKSKVSKTDGVGTLLEVSMSKKCTSLWCEAHFQGKMYKTHHSALLEVERLKKCTPLWREAHFQVKMSKTHQNTRCTDHFWTFRCRKSAPRCCAKHIWKSKVMKTEGFQPFLTFRCR